MTLTAQPSTTIPCPATALVCRNCGADYPLVAIHACAACFGPLEVGYDESIQASVTREQIESGPKNLWRYVGLLPRRRAFDRRRRKASPRAVHGVLAIRTRRPPSRVRR